MRFPVDIPPLPRRARLSGSGIRRGASIRASLRSGEKPVSFLQKQGYDLEGEQAAPERETILTGQTGEGASFIERRSMELPVLLDTRVQSSAPKPADYAPVDIEV